MAIEFNSLAPALAPPKTAQTGLTHAAAPGAGISANHWQLSASRGRGTNVAGSFGSLLASGLAAAGAASALARSAATAAAGNAIATATAPASSVSGASTPAAAQTAAEASDPNAATTAEQMFGANPWLSDPTGTGPNGLSFEYNPVYFATASTAAQVAQMVGGKVVQDNEFTKDAPGNPFAQLQSNEMVQLPDGALINPGLVASFYTHGYPNWMVNQQIANEVAGAEDAVTSTGA